MPLVIKPVKLNKSIYVRVPNDIADLIGLQARDALTLTYQDLQGEVRLTYTVHKSNGSTRPQVNTPLIQRDSNSVVQQRR